jgi:multidrug resistance efflux pump
MKPRSRIFFILGLLFLLALVFYYFTVNHQKDLQLIGTVDANEVIVSSRIPGRIQTLTVDEGQRVRAGELIAVIQSDDLQAALRAAEANSVGARFKLQESRETEWQTAGESSSQVVDAEAQLQAAQAALAQARAQYQHQLADSRRIVALAEGGIMSEQQRDDAATSLDAAKAAVEIARHNVSAAAAALAQSRAHTLQAKAAARTADATRQDMLNAQAEKEQAEVNLDYSRVYSPIAGQVNVRAARQGEVVAAGTPIVTVVDLTQTWVYAPLPETEADAVQIGDSLRVVMPSGAQLWGQVIAKSALGDFATQRDVSRRKRDIETVQLKLLIANPGMRYVPGMTAEVYIPRSKLARP